MKNFKRKNGVYRPELFSYMTESVSNVIYRLVCLSFSRMFALQRMKEAGAYISTSESMLLTLCGGSSHPKFKEIQKLIWDAAPDSNLIPNK